MLLPPHAAPPRCCPQKFEFRELQWSLWDRWVLEGDLSVAQVLAWFRERGLEAYSISCGHSLLYNNIFPKHKERLDKKMSDLVTSVAKMEVPANRCGCAARVCGAVLRGRGEEAVAAVWTVWVVVRGAGAPLLHVTHRYLACPAPPPALPRCRNHFDVVVACEDEEGGE